MGQQARLMRRTTSVLLSRGAPRRRAAPPTHFSRAGVPVANPRPDKVAVVAEVPARLQRAEAAVLPEYRGLNVSATADLRNALRAAGGDYKIYKNTLVRFAAHGLGLEIDHLLTGPTAIAFVDGDPVVVAKALRDFARSNPAL